MSFDPSNGISTAGDVQFNGLNINHLIRFDATSSEWKNASTSALVSTYGILVTEHGVVPNTNLDQADAIQNCIDTFGRICIPSGQYLCNSPLKVDSNDAIYLAKGCKLVKNFGNGEPLIKNRDFGNGPWNDPDPARRPVKVNNFTMWGPGSLGAFDRTTQEGNIFFIYGDNMRFVDFTIDGYYEGKAMMVAGDNVRLHNIQAINPEADGGAGGIRVLGGDNFIATNCYIDSGDDALQFVPLENPDGRLFDMDITNSAFINCTGFSRVARFIVVVTGFAVPPYKDQAVMTASVRNVSFINCRGTGGRRAIMISNPSSSGVVENIVVRDCTIDMSTGDEVNSEITIDGFHNTELGGVKKVKFINVAVPNPSTCTLSVQSQVEDVLIENCAFERTTRTGSINRPVMDLNGTNTRVVGGVFDGKNSDSDVITVSKNDPDGGPPLRATFNGARIIGIANGKSGISITNCVDPRISDCSFEQHAAATNTAKAINLSSTVSGARVDNNNFRSINSLTKYINDAIGTIFLDNIGDIVENNSTFSLALIPDTQYTLTQVPEAFTQMTQWIVDNADTEKIRYVLHEGDIQEYPVSKGSAAEGDINTVRYYPLAKSSMDVLRGHVPYIITPGNHDFDAWSGYVEGQPNTERNSDWGESALVDRSTTLFNRYFPVSDFNDPHIMPGFRDNYPAGSNDNSYHEFSAGGTDWGILAVKYEPINAELTWANNIVNSNPNRRFIILTHTFLAQDEQEPPDEPQLPPPRTGAGNNIWNNLVKLHVNISFVFSGHLRSLYDSSRRVDNGVNGNPVHQMLFDYQSPNQPDPNTYFRMLYFDTAARTLTAKTFSPSLNNYRSETTEDFIITDAPIGPIN